MPKTQQQQIFESQKADLQAADTIASASRCVACLTGKNCFELKIGLNGLFGAAAPRIVAIRKAAYRGT
jgi:hypothetical protein